MGKGTKHLQQFLMCTKAYEATLLFGAATDTYDVQGKLLSKAPYSHVTREKVEEALAAFRGQIMQRPPIYSALRIQGKHLYEYAREGKELPVEIQERPVTVAELEITEWLEPGSHAYKWPKEEAPQEEKEVAETVLHLLQDGAGGASAERSTDNQTSPTGTKRKREAAYVEGDLIYDTNRTGKRQEKDTDVVMSGGLLETTEDGLQETSAMAELATPTAADQEPSQIQITIAKDATPPLTTAPPLPPNRNTVTKSTPTPPTTPAGPPAVKLRMTVTSGFYVRSLCHDLGKAVGSLGIMAELVRTRQGEFALGKNALEYADLEEGEGVWGPRVKAMLEGWQAGVEGDGRGVVGGGEGDEVEGKD